MYEIPFVSAEILDQPQKERAKRQTARMVELTAVADKLAAADWPIEWTMTGLAFELPYKIKYGPEAERTPAAIKQKLASMGIPDAFRLCSSRSLLEVVTVKSEYADRVRYAELEQSVRYFAGVEFPDWDSQNFIVTTVPELMEMEERYGRKVLITEDGYERGTVKGRRQALDWLLVEEWPELEPEDEFEAEMVEADRVYLRQDLAIGGLHTLLFGEQEAKTGKSEQAGSTQPVLADTPTANAMPPAATAPATKVAEAMARLKANKMTAEPSAN
jgi:hypothetical protein